MNLHVFLCFFLVVVLILDVTGSSIRLNMLEDVAC